jgi:hypothetical protein
MNVKITILARGTASRVKRPQCGFTLNDFGFKKQARAGESAAGFLGWGGKIQ